MDSFLGTILATILLLAAMFPHEAGQRLGTFIAAIERAAD